VWQNTRSQSADLCSANQQAYRTETTKPVPEHWPNEPSRQQLAYLRLKGREVMSFRAYAGVEIRPDDAGYCRKYLVAIEKPELVKSSKAIQMNGNGA
jgi:hypothetical protein